MSSTDLQDLEVEERRYVKWRNNDIRGMKMEKSRQVKRKARP